MRLLEVQSVAVDYGELRAVFGVSLEVEEGESLALVGANGAGKTTLLRTIAGALRPASGRVRFAGEDVTALPAQRRVRRGIALVPEGRQLFSSLTVEENLKVGAYRGREGPWTLDAVYELFPLVADRRRRPASILSGGEQQAVAIGRALMANPRLLLLDEVSLGLAPRVVDGLYEALPTITRAASVVLVEQELDRARASATRLVCLLAGRVVLTGRPSELRREDIVDAYFGLQRAGDERP
jgi:branched-chain amino acid transport system ATP-binding protein